MGTYLSRLPDLASDMNKVYGFEGEAKQKLGDMTYKLFADVFTSCQSALTSKCSSFAQCCAVPLATLVTASQPPSSGPMQNSTKPPILSPAGLKRFFIVHGGPPCSKDGVSLEEIEQIPRLGQQPGQTGLMCEMLWTDPQEQPGRGPSKRVHLLIKSGVYAS